jgi:activator of HSP90 ATPase
MKTIKQTVEFKASPEEVYEALMDQKKHSAFTGADAKVSRRVGGAFTVWDGYATGKNLELVPGKKIVQSWRVSEWPEGTESKVTFSFAKTKKGTKLTFTQTGVPDDAASDIAQGWKDYYWKPMKGMLDK